MDIVIHNIYTRGAYTPLEYAYDAWNREHAFDEDSRVRVAEESQPRLLMWLEEKHTLVRVE